MHVLNYAKKAPTPGDPAIYEPIINAILKGHPQPTAAALAGIHEDTLFHWRYKGQDELAAAAGNWIAWDELSSHAQLVIRIKEAQAGLVDEALGHIRAGGKDWAAWMTLLERRFPNDFGRNQRIEIEHNVNVTHRLELGSAEAAILARIVELESIDHAPVPDKLLPEATSST